MSGFLPDWVGGVGEEQKREGSCYWHSATGTMGTECPIILDQPCTKNCPTPNANSEPC